MLRYHVQAQTAPDGRGEAAARSAAALFDAHPQGLEGRMNPAEMLLSAFAACVLKNVARYGQMLNFSWQKAAIEVTGERQDAPPRMVSLHYRLTVWTDEPPRRLELLHRNIQKFGTIYNTIAAACTVTGEIVAQPPERA